MLANPRIAALALATALVFTASACGGGDDASDKIAEQIAEEASGGDVDLDSEDGTVSFTDDEGNVSEFDVDGEGAELPEDWPAELAPPASVRLITSTTNTVDGVTSLYVLGETEGTVDELFEGIKTQVGEAGFEITSDTSMSGSDGAFASLSASDADWDLDANVTAGSTEGTVSITMGLTAKAP